MSNLYQHGPYPPSIRSMQYDRDYREATPEDPERVKAISLEFGMWLE